MSDLTTSKTTEFEALDEMLTSSVDKEILKDLEYYLDIVKRKSKALATSLKRCFDNARKSMRYLMVYELGRKDAVEKKDIKKEEMESYLEEYLKDYFEKNDFMHYREFVRLNRACAIDVGIDVSSKIKDMYNEFFLGKRLIIAYKLGFDRGAKI